MRLPATGYRLSLTELEEVPVGPISAAAAILLRPMAISVGPIFAATILSYLCVTTIIPHVLTPCLYLRPNVHHHLPFHCGLLLKRTNTTRIEAEGCRRQHQKERGFQWAMAPAFQHRWWRSGQIETVPAFRLVGSVPVAAVLTTRCRPY